MTLSACNKKAALFMSAEPINANNISVVQEKPTFAIRQKIYFLLASKNPIECPVLRLQILKLENKYGYPISKIDIAYAIDFERGSNEHIASDYFVLQESGDYFIRIFSLQNLRTPIAEADFKVEN